MFTGTLLPYQEDAVAQMVGRHKMLVAYDLGLGKTVITLASCERLREMHIIDGPVLVVALASLKYQWAKEVGKFTNSSATVIDGTKKKRAEQWLHALEHQYVVANYETVVNDWDHVTQLPLGALVLDEATAVKSFRSKRSKRIKELSRRTEVRFALTGTPIENGRPEEIFSIMQAVDGRLLGRFDHFDNAFIVRGPFGNVERYRNLDVLHKRLSSNLIRKTQSDPDVAPHMPDTIHRDPVLVPMDRHLRDLYRQVGSDLEEELTEAISSFGSNWSLSSHYGQSSPNHPPSELMGSIMARITLLRQLCSHPELVVESAVRFQCSLDAGVLQGGSPLAFDLYSNDDADVIETAKVPKLDELKRMVSDHCESDERAKVVIFTSFLLTADLIQKSIGGVVYSGKMNAEAKERAKEQFQTDPDIRVLISTDAGGYGVDLPQANLLINYDLPWSAGRAVQRNGRIRRASSKWPTVVIQDLLVERSIEIRQFDLLQQKTSVAGAVIDGQGINTRGGVDFSAGSLLSHLRETL